MNEIIKTESNKRFIKLIDPWKGMPTLNDIIPSKNIPKSNLNYQIVEYPLCLDLFNTLIILKVLIFESYNKS